MHASCLASPSPAKRLKTSSQQLVLMKKPAGAEQPRSTASSKATSATVSPKDSSTQVMSYADKVFEHFAAHKHVLQELTVVWWPRNMRTARGKENYQITARCGSAFTIRLAAQCICFTHSCKYGSVKNCPKPHTFTFKRQEDKSNFIFSCLSGLCDCPKTTWIPIP